MCQRTVACQQMIDRLRETVLREPGDLVTWALDIARQAGKLIVRADADAAEVAHDEQRIAS